MPRFSKMSWLLAGLVLVPIALRARTAAPWRRSCPILRRRRRRHDVAARVDHPLCARLYVRQSEQAERLGLAARRSRLLDGLAGTVLEVGAGNGLTSRTTRRP